MPKIKNIAVDQVIHGTDKLLGSDQGSTTRNYQVKDIAAWMDATNAVGSSIRFAWQYMSTADGCGEFSSDSSAWASITSITVSKYHYDNCSDIMAPDALNVLANRDIVIVELNDRNIWGAYWVSNIAVNSSNSDFYDLTLTYKTHKGTPSTGLVYAIQDIASDGLFQGTVLVTKNLRRTVTTVTHSSNTHTCDFSLNDNFIINANAATNTIALTITSDNVGQSGNIIINNASSGTVAFAALPSYMHTPSGATVNFVTGNSKSSVLSYIVLATNKVFVNYIGDFS